MIKRDTIQSIENLENERYSGRLKTQGISPRTLGWGCTEDQEVRFQKILEEFDLHNKTIMDIGCGFADFYKYILSQNEEYNIRYIGVDTVPEFVEHCKKTYPEQSFYCKNLLLDEGLPEVDIVVSLGVLNLKLKEVDNWEYSKVFIQKLLSLAKELVIVDFLSENRTKDYPKEDFVYYHSPVQVFNFASEFSNNLKLVHNYQPIPQKEFMIGIYK